MIEEFDLRHYLLVVLRRWKLIIGIGLLAAIVAFTFTSFMPPVYRATAVIIVTLNQEVIMTSLINEELEPRLSTINKLPQPLRTFSSLATSDAVVGMLLTKLEPPISNVETVDDLQAHLIAEPGEDLSLLYLSVDLDDPVQAATIANKWADIVVTQFNLLYGGLGQEQVAFYEEQLAQVAAELEATDQAYISFQGENDSVILENQLEVLQNSQKDYLAWESEIQVLSDAIEMLRDQIAAQSEVNPVTLAEQLLVLGLQSRALGIENGVPLQVQTVSDVSLTTSNRQEQIAALDSLLAALQTHSLMVETQLEGLVPQILELQTQKSTVELEEEHLRRSQTVIGEAYTALLRKVIEERISAEDTSSGTKLASLAIVPEEPVGPRRLVNTITAGLLGLMLGVAVVLGTEFLRKKPES